MGLAGERDITERCPSCHNTSCFATVQSAWVLLERDTQAANILDARDPSAARAGPILAS